MLELFAVVLYFVVSVVQFTPWWFAILGLWIVWSFGICLYKGSVAQGYWAGYAQRQAEDA